MRYIYARALTPSLRASHMMHPGPRWSVPSHQVVIILKALARSIAKSILININLFTLESIRVYKAILVLLVNSIQAIIRYCPPIRLLKSIPYKLIPRESRLESLSRPLLFLSSNYHSYKSHFHRLLSP